MLTVPFSCDTSVVLGRATADGSTILAKNSDRSANEAQPLIHVPARSHAPGSLVRCQYVEIPQVEHTFEVIGSRPCWLWGFEMGVNEWGVAIGNEAVLTREPSEEISLIGMDIVRLALERAASAHEAVDVISAMIETYGQGGSCEEHFFRTYHNSFMVADPESAWIVETAGHRWVASEVKDRAAIGNMLTIGETWDTGSAGVADHARERGWAGDAVSWAAAYTDPDADLSTRVCRLDRNRAILASLARPATVRDMMGLLADHGDRDLPERAEPLPTLCVHACPGFLGETAAAMVAHLRPERPRELTATVWTAFGSPCTSLYRPVYPFAVGLPAHLNIGASSYSEESPWWTFERLQRAVAAAPGIAPWLRDELAPVQGRIFAETAAAEDAAAALLELGDSIAARALLRDLVNQTTDQALSAANALISNAEQRASEARNEVMSQFWSELNATAKMP